MKKHFFIKFSVLTLLVVLVLSIPSSVFANFTDVKTDATYLNSLNRLVDLGIISGDQKSFKPDDLLTREQFTKMIVVAAGLESTANSMKGDTGFPDVTAKAWSSGYVKAAVSKGYITGEADGKFHPTDPITFSQICTILIKALGYAPTDLPGSWPNNYIIKANEIGLTDGIDLGNSAGVPRWAAAVMIDRMLDANMKQNASSASAQTFLESTGYYIKCIIFGDSSTMSSLKEGQVLTDKGTFNNPNKIHLELGSENYIAVKNGNIQKATVQADVLKLSVKQAAGNKVTYMDGNGNASMVLPDNITYYYQGQKIEFKDLQAKLQKNASLVLNYNTDKAGFSFAVVFDPVYSKPEIAHNFVPSSGRLGSIGLSGNPTIIKDGVAINVSQIQENDVVYQVTDIWGGDKYILALDNKVGGKITGILPDKLSPKTLQIDNVNYDFSPDIDLNGIIDTFDLSVDSNIVVYLGYDGKIVSIEGFGTENNSDYAIVLNSGAAMTTGTNGAKTYTYTAKLLFSDGVTATYNVDSNSSGLKGQLVQYSFKDAQTVSLEQLSYNFPGEAYIKKDERMMDSSYVADNVKIFNLVFNGSGDVQANILKWSDLPGGTIPAGKIWYTNTAGAFNDVNVIFTDDILNERYKQGMIKSASYGQSAQGTTYDYAVLIDGKEYKYNNYNANFSVGSVFRFEMNSSGIASISNSVAEAATGTNVQAVDSRRIKLNNKIYYFNKNVSVYYRDSNGTITAKTLADIDTAGTYQKVALYTDNSNDSDSKVNIVYLVE